MATVVLVIGEPAPVDRMPAGGAPSHAGSHFYRNFYRTGRNGRLSTGTD